MSVVIVKFILIFLLINCHLGYAITEYLLDSNDMLQIEVIQDESLNKKDILIDKDGKIELGYAGKISLKNMTVPAARKKIKKHLEKDFLKKANVKIEIMSYGSKMVKIYGEIKVTGEKYLKTNKSLIPDIIALANGKTKLASEMAYVVRNYKDKSPFKIIEKRKYSTPKGKMDYIYKEVVQSKGFEVLPGDFIYIPPVFRVTLVGEVLQEGTYTFSYKPDIVRAIAAARGFKKTAGQKNIIVKRKTPDGIINIPVNYKNSINNDKESFLLLTNDVVVVPESWF